MKTPARSLLLLPLCALLACGTPDTTPTDGGATDSGHTTDSGTPFDAGSDGGTDAGVSVTVTTDVLTDDGPVHGSTSGGLVLFKGIPFAAPPTGSLRWAPPVRPTPWTTPLQATAFGPPCPQAKNTPSPQSEACLNLNVWAHPEGAPRPVLVWIHGGGFVEGAANEGWYDAATLALSQELVVVSIDYRLGVLGFLTLPQLAAADTGTGNWGLRDQVAALEWVKRNIAAFGGDPSRVMIAGESAGGISVTALLASPKAQGLFHRAAIQSGSHRVVMEKEQPTGSLPSGYLVGTEVAIRLGCTAGNIPACLRGKTFAEVLTAQGQLAQVAEIGIPITPTLPVVDGVVLTERPLAALAAGRGDVPLIVGANDDEASFVVKPLFAAGALTSFGQYVDLVGAGGKKTELTALYQPSVVGEEVAATAFGTDLSFACPAERLATVSAATGTAPAHLYRWARTLPNGGFSTLGATHGTDVVYLFGQFPQVGTTPGASDNTLSSQVQAAWGSLARAGVPSTTPAWPAYSAGGSFLTLDTPLATGSVWRAGRCAQLSALGLLQP